MYTYLYVYIFVCLIRLLTKVDVKFVSLLDCPIISVSKITYPFPHYCLI